MNTGVTHERASRAGRRFLFACLVGLLVACGLPRQAYAQLTVPPVPTTTLNYTFDLPLAKVVPNPCTTGLVLITGNNDIAISTVQGTGFTLTVQFNSAGKGEDVLSDGTSIPDGTQKINYVYSAQIGLDAEFPEKPETFAQTFGVKDYLVRADGDKTDSFYLNAVFELTFTNGVPSTPILQQIDLACEK